MATTTINLGLRKPSPSDPVDVTADISDNMDLIDAAIGPGGIPDMFSGTLTGVDVDVSTISLGQSSFTLPLSGEKTGGFLSVVCIPIKLAALGEFEFVFIPSFITQEYMLQVAILVTNLASTSKLLITDSYPLTVENSGVPLSPNGVLSWTPTLVGTDLGFSVDDPVVKVQSTAGGIYTAELSLAWFAK